MKFHTEKKIAIFCTSAFILYTQNSYFMPGHEFRKKKVIFVPHPRPYPRGNITHFISGMVFFQVINKDLELYNNF